MIDNTNFVKNLLILLNEIYEGFTETVQPIIDILGTDIALLPGIDPSLLPEWAVVNVGAILLGAGFLALIPLWIIKTIL